MSYNKLKEYVIPDGVTTVREGSVPHFEVGSVKIPNSVTKIGHHAFYCCVDLKSVEIPSSVKILDESAFASCRDLSSVTIPEDSSLKYIYHGAFRNCFNLKSITIPSSVEHISPFVFEGCKDLTIICEKGSYAEHYAKREGIAVSTDGKALGATSKASPDAPSHTHKKAFHL